MDKIDYYFVIPAAAVILWELYGLAVCARRISIFGRPAGTAGSRVFLVVLILAALLAPSDIAKLPVIYGCAFLIFLLHGFFVRAGIGEKGFYWSALQVPYQELEYYQDIRDYKGGFSMRFHTRSGKDYVVLFREEQRGDLIAMLTEHRFRDYDSFRFFDEEE